MLLERQRETVNPHPPCEQPAENVGTAARKNPSHLVLRWRGVAPTVQEFIGHDVTFAYVISVGLREGDTVILTACHWSAQVWGRC
jgi:hypothetical protein